jgi:hypothetical protein
MTVSALSLISNDCVISPAGVALSLAALMTACDLATLTGLLTARVFLRSGGGGGLTASSFALGCVATAGLVLLQAFIAALLVQCLQTMQDAQPRLKALGLDTASVRGALLSLGLGLGQGGGDPFAGPGQVVVRAGSSGGGVAPTPAPAVTNIPAAPLRPMTISAAYAATTGHSAASTYAPVPRLDDEDEEEGDGQRQGGPPAHMSEAGVAALARLSRSQPQPPHPRPSAGTSRGAPRKSKK